MKTVALTLLLTISRCFGGVSDHLKTNYNFGKNSPIKGVDAIYMINLDDRPNRFEESKAKLAPYGIEPHRFPAINGWELSQEVIDDVGLTFDRKMPYHQWVRCLSSNKDSPYESDFLSSKSQGKTVFTTSMTLGGLGCALSHLSVLQNAYDAGFKTIWVLEDDVLVKQDPSILQDLIQKLDKTLGKKGWDILYTDSDVPSEGFDPEKDIPSTFWKLPRPDMKKSWAPNATKRTVLDENFVQIGSRVGAHSMIIRRSGMKKILDFIKSNRIFLRQDLEKSLPPGIILVNLRQDVVTAPKFNPVLRDDLINGKTFDPALSQFDLSDTEHYLTKDEIWKACKVDAINVINQVTGYREPEKARRIMDFIIEKKPKLCVEIGAFGGTMTYPIARSLKHIGSGLLYAVDSWNYQDTIRGLSTEKEIDFWKGINFPGIYEGLRNILSMTNTHQYCQLVSKTSEQAASLFQNETLDLIYIDGNESLEGSLHDVTLYYPKVKKGGYIWLNRADDKRKSEAVRYLMQHATWLEKESPDIGYILFQK